MGAGRGHVLVVEDDADIRVALTDALGDEGYAVVEAADGQRALDYLRTHPAPSLILLDWNMAPMNGFQFMAEVARDAAFAQIPVILLTADTRAPEKAARSPFVGLLLKPVNLDALLAMVARYCA